MGWYISIVPLYYQYYKIYILKTRSKRIAKTVKFYPNKINVLKITQEESILVTATNLIDALKYHNNKLAVIDAKTTNEALYKLASICVHKARLAVTNATKDNHLIYASKIIPIPKLPVTKLNLKISMSILDNQYNDILNNSLLPNITEPETRVKTRSFSAKIMSKKNY